ncbi:MAG TPA: polysaccharide deacetylase family protein [Rhizobiaceae bacterium]|nr:polysaccharide deacetylase family protein [Rhizobiaceae bacterium]
MKRTDLLQRLGFDPGQRVAILHADDVGMCHGANAAFLELARAGRLTCGSVMMPCPWSPEIARIAAEDGTLDLGAHLTLTSEWTSYRWGPLTRAGKASGLVDDEGYFHRTVAALVENIVADAAEEEMRAQIDRALAYGIDVTHLDTHMGAALSPPLIEAYCRIGRDYRLPVLLPRRPEYYARVLKLDLLGPNEALSAAAKRLDEGAPLVDDFRMTPGAPSEDSTAAYRELVETLPDGLTFIALHPNLSGDIEKIVPPRAHHRTDEVRLLGSGAMAGWLEENGIGTVGMRPLRDLYREAASR